MSSHARVLNVTNGCRIKRSQALGRIEHCISVWVEEGFAIRDLSLPERIQARAKQAQMAKLSQEVLGCSGEIGGCWFVPPASTTYRAPREAYEEMTAPLGVRVCRWPRQAHEFAAAQ